MAVDLRESSDDDAEAVCDLVHGILTEEFGFSEPAARQPDLLDVPGHNGQGASNFWIAEVGGLLIGTAGFVDLGSGNGLLRKYSFVPISDDLAWAACC